jgi:hypothetical protein
MTITAPATRLEDKTTARIFWAGAEKETVRIERPRPEKYRGRHRLTWRNLSRRRSGYLVSLVSLLSVGALGCAGTTTPDSAPPDAPSYTTVTKQPLGPGQISDGQLEVGADIKAGTYTTTVPADVLNCYWARLRNFDGELGSIVANGNLKPGAKGRLVVKATDAGVELSGGCIWSKAAAK